MQRLNHKIAAPVPFSLEIGIFCHNLGIHAHNGNGTWNKAQLNILVVEPLPRPYEEAAESCGQEICHPVLSAYLHQYRGEKKESFGS